MRYSVSLGDGKVYGPFDASQLGVLVQKGRIDPHTLLCPENGAEWRAAGELLPTLFVNPAAAHPPVPPVPPAPPAPQPSVAAAGAPRAADGQPSGPDDLSSPVFLPSRLVAGLIEKLAEVARGGFFQTASAHAWTIGQYAFLAGVVALMVFVAIVAIRTDSLAMMGSVLVIPVAAAVAQFSALRFAPTNELLVQNSPLRASGETFFQLLGLVYILSAAGLAVLGFYLAVKGGDMTVAVGAIIAAGILTVIGFLFFSPTTLSLTIDPRASAGEDGLALIGTFIKSLLASSRLIFGLLVIIGGVAVVTGTLWFLVKAGDPRPFALVTTGAMTLAFGAIYPLYSYLIAILYFVFVDAIKGLISLGKPGESGTR